jgi:hypothetical protein
MTDQEYEALHEALVAANKILPAEKDCDKRKLISAKRFANLKNSS